MVKSVKILGREVALNVFSEADNSVFEEIFRDLDYKILEEKIRMAGDLIVDIGAHKGYFSIYAAIINSAVPIFAYEPESDNFKWLKENLKLNRIKNVMPKNVAVFSREGTLELHLSEDSHNHSLFGEGVAKRVEAISLNKILGKVRVCDLVKMDCEGAEFAILENLEKENFAKVKMFYVEYHEYEPEMQWRELKKIFEKNGFKVRVFPSRYDGRMGFVLAEK